ncbi:MAG: methyltransferase domain-containing protein [candidate division Zixibacteria bacterium]|jgi:trans-aconitate 2-methyltransferase|nr:methyltransferase domain-containing protein [candidate division Zixibacteria bacterium]
MTWDPTTYLAHATLRERPTAELLARIPLETAERIYDLGCGTGNSTALLRTRWPEARITGVDSSETMLTRARQSGLNADWQLADLSSFVPPDRPRLVFSNAAYHWIDDHRTVFTRLADCLTEGGVLAIQMPANFDAPSHTLLREVASDGPWAEDVADIRPANPIHPAADYYDILSGHCRTVDIWYTEYLQVMTGDNPVLGWVKGTALVPYLDRLQADVRERFLAAYASRLRRAYPPGTDGTTLFPFRRLFVVAQRH